MNQLFKFVCVFMLLNAPVHAMQEVNELGELVLAAARLDNHKEIERLLEEGAPANYTNNYGNNPLLITASFGHLNCLQALIKAQAQVNYASCNGVSPLMIAANRGNFGCVHALLAAKADVNHEDTKGATALIYASPVETELPCIRALLAAGARVNHTDKQGDTALMQAEREGRLEACELFVTALLSIPNQEQKARIVTFFALGKKYGKKYGFATGFISTLKAPLLEAVYNQNKNNFANSIACREVNKLPGNLIKQALLDKYNGNEGVTESPRTKRAKITQAYSHLIMTVSGVSFV